MVLPSAPFFLSGTTSRVGFHLGSIALALIFLLALTPVSALAASNQCKEQDLQNQLLGLASIEKNFQQLASGVIHSDFSLSSLFTVDLLDQLAVKERRSELENYHPNTAVDCPQENIKQLANKQRQALSDITNTRLRYLSLPYDERHYLVTLIAIYQDLNSQLSLITSNEQQFQKDLAQLQALINKQELRYKSLQAADDRTELFNKISDTKNELQTLNNVYDKDQQTAKIISPLLALSKSLLIDYHRIYNLSTGEQKFGNTSNELFQQLTSPKDLNSLVRLTTEKQRPSEYKSKLAALIIIHGRIHTHSRQNQTLSQLTDNGLTGLVKKLKLELKTLMALPTANIHFKLSPSDEHNYLSQTFFQSATNLATQLLLLLAFGIFLRRLPDWINATQQHIVRNYLDRPVSRPAISTLRFLQPNSQWLGAILLYYYLDSQPDSILRDWILIYDIIAIVAFYLLVRTLASGAISNTNSQAHLFVLRSKQLNIKLQCHRFALYTTLASMLYIVLETLLKGGIICTIYQIVLLITIWIFSYRTISAFQPEFTTHLSKRVSEQAINRFTQLQKPFVKAVLNPAIFIGLQLLDIIIAIHNRLLRLERYQTLTAKFLKIRLEQSQSNTPEPEQEEQQDDTHYENWFLNKELVEAKPNLLVQSPWLQDMNQNICGWLEEKQDENDLALIGENGIGKSTLLRQWLEQWDKSKTVYIKTPAKTLKEHDIFKLVCESLSLENCEDIAQFVTQQQTLEKTVIVIDEAHHLFLSDVGGFEAYKKLQDLISAKLKNIFWVVAINHQSWIYLNDVFSQTYQFSSSITMQRWTQQGIRDLILRRHKFSRRQLRFDELLLASTSHSETATRAAESRCFSLLWDQSSGIPSVALSIWMNSARNPAKGLIEMGIPERPNSSALQNLSDDHLFVYAALVVHESLNTQQAHAVTHLSEAIVRRTLKQGLDQGFLKRKSHGRYIINPLWQIQLCQLLRRKNFLHE